MNSEELKPSRQAILDAIWKTPIGVVNGTVLHDDAVKLAEAIEEALSLPTQEPSIDKVEELFTLDQIERAYEAWSAGDVPQTFPAMMRESGWFMAGKQSRFAALQPQAVGE